jgi:hypothetical protein
MRSPSRRPDPRWSWRTDRASRPWSRCSSAEQSGQDAGSNAEDAGVSTGQDASTGEDASTPADPDALVGSFQLKLVAPVAATESTPETPGYTTLVGKLYDGPTPSLVVWEVAASEGDCKLLTPRVPFCSTPCGGSAACVEDDTCQAYPTSQSAGTVHITGLQRLSGEAELDINPGSGGYQLPGDAQLAFPPFEAGERVSLEAAGAQFPAFALSASGVGLLSLAEDPIVLAEGSALTLRWTAAQSPDASRIGVELDVSHHGGTKGKIVCETADSGSLEIPASQVTGLLRLGVAGFPAIVVTRSNTGTASTSNGKVELVISSQVKRDVEIAGLTSCDVDADCPDGQTCQSDLTCQ